MIQANSEVSSPTPFATLHEKESEPIDPVLLRAEQTLRGLDSELRLDPLRNTSRTRNRLRRSWIYGGLLALALLGSIGYAWIGSAAKPPSSQRMILPVGDIASVRFEHRIARVDGADRDAFLVDKDEDRLIFKALEEDREVRFLVRLHDRKGTELEIRARGTRNPAERQVPDFTR